MNESTVKTLEQRLERAEKEVRLLRWVLIFGLTAGLLGWIAIPRAGQYEIVMDDFRPNTPKYRVDTTTGKIHEWDESLHRYLTSEEMKQRREEKEAQRRANAEAWRQREARKAEVEARWMKDCQTRNGTEEYCAVSTYEIFVLELAIDDCDLADIRDGHCFVEFEANCMGELRDSEDCRLYLKKLLELSGRLPVKEGRR